MCYIFVGQFLLVCHANAAWCNGRPHIMYGQVHTRAHEKAFELALAAGRVSTHAATLACVDKCSGLPEAADRGQGWCAIESFHDRLRPLHPPNSSAFTDRR